MSDQAHESHTGPIKTPRQLLWTSFFAFVLPVVVIIGLVFYVTRGDKPAVGAANPELAMAQRIQRVGAVELRDANRPPRSGEEVYKGQCFACHATGAAGSPKFGDAGAWGPRIAAGLDALVTSALKGKNAMPAQGGGDFDDTEIARAVAFMANAGGAKFAEPAAAGGAAKVDGEAIYKNTCSACHGTGVSGAPKFGDRAAWAPRVGAGIDGLTASAIKGKNAMPPKGGSSASDAEIKAAVTYMVNAAK